MIRLQNQRWLRKLVGRARSVRTLAEKALTSGQAKWRPRESAWLIRMTWRNLAFLHWPLPTEIVVPHLPSDLEVDTFQENAWISISPLHMSGVRPRFLPALPPYRSFHEVNLRTYVRIENEPGVWFFSLDASSRLAVQAARLSFSLPYFPARISMERDGDEFRFSSRRLRPRAPSACLSVRYRPVGEVYRTKKETLEYWLTERYCMYSADERGRVWRGKIHHQPWPLQPAEAVVEENSLAAPLGINLAPAASLTHFARSLSVVAWAPERVA